MSYSVRGDETPRFIVRQLVETVRSNVTIDWTLWENLRAHIRVLSPRVCAGLATCWTSRRSQDSQCWSRWKSCLKGRPSPVLGQPPSPLSL